MLNKVKVLKSFIYAIRGIKYCVEHERHMRFHLLATVLAVILGWLFNITIIEWLFLLFTITLVLVLEMINTAIERAIDLITPKYHPYAEVAKNVAAGAVLVAALNALIVGAVIFLF